MSAIIYRSALIAWGQKPPPDLAYVTVDPCRVRQIVTWSEVIEKRRKWQAERLRRIREYRVWRARRVWVAYYDMDLFGGWQAFIDDRRGRTWIDRDGRGLVPTLLKLFPLVLSFDEPEDHRWRFGETWHSWKIEFAKQFRRGTHDRRPRGAANVWERDGQIQRTRPTEGEIAI